MENLLQRVRAALAGRYEVVSEAGRGAMAVVYRAVDLRHDRTVAVKVLRPQLASAVGEERFLHEIRLAAGLAHPYVLPVLDSGEVDGLLYYVMPFVEGETLARRLAREGELPVDDAIKIASEIAEALGHAHAAGILHRDVKPSNILLTESHALLADFGVARALDPTGDERLTGTGLSVGSPAYMCPQQADPASTADPRDDQYSLACVLYEMLAGAPPFSGGSATAVMRRHAVDELPPVRTVRPYVPRHVEAAIARATAKSRADRFATMDAFKATLERGPSPTRRPWASRRQVIAAVLLLGVAAAAVAVWRAPRSVAFTQASSGAVPLGPAIPACVPSSEADVGYARDLAQMTGLYLSQAALRPPPVPWEYLRAWPAENDLSRGAVILPDTNPQLFDSGDVERVLTNLRAGYFVHCFMHPETGGYSQLDIQLFDRAGEIARDTLRIPRDTVNTAAADLAATLLRRLDPGLGSRLEGWSDSIRAWRYFLEADSAFREYKLGLADSLFGLAVEADPEFGLALWHRHLVHRWEAIPEDSDIDLDSLLEADRDRFSPRDLMLIEAETAPPDSESDGRFKHFEAVIRAYPADAYARLMYADELFHRGSLAETGIGTDSARNAMKMVVDSLTPAWGPAWDHLVLMDLILGDERGARAALDQLCGRFPAKPTAFEPCNYWRVGYYERFQPDSAAQVYRPFIKSQPDPILLRATRFTRYANLYDAELDLGATLVTRGVPFDSLWLSGKNAMGIAHMAMGQPANALAQFRDAAAAGKRARLLADLWEVIPRALRLEGFAGMPPDERLRATASLSELATAGGSDSLTAGRAAWGLALDAAGGGDRSAFDRWRALVDSVAPRSENRRFRMTRLLDALEAAQFDGAADSALTLSAPLMAYDSLGITERPFSRAVLYLLRGRWHADAGDPQKALDAWMWHENADLESLPMRDVQTAEVDGALSGWARLWSARLAQADGRMARACREAREALRLWRPDYRSPRNPEQTLLEEIAELREIASATCAAPGVPP